MLTKPLPGIMDDPFHPLSQGCVCHLLFNEGAGNLAYDVSGHGNHGTLKNMLPNTQGSKWQGSKFGGGLAFDGVDDFVNFTSLDMASISFSIWIYSDTKGDSDYPRIVLMPGYAILFFRKTGVPNQTNTLQFVSRRGTQDGQWHTPENGITDGNWYHIVATYDSSSVDKNPSLYINGISQSVYENKPPQGTQTSNVGIGYIGNRSAEDRSFDGTIDDVRIYTRALSAEEVKQLYEDPFCNLLQVPTWQLYAPSAAVIGRSRGYIF